MPSEIRNRLFIISIIVLGIACYANVVHNGFVWDDEYLIKQNECVKNIQLNIGKVFTNNLLIGSPKKSIYYRPLQILSYGIDYKFWRLDPLGYHLSNLLLHILNALLAYHIIKRIAPDISIAFLSALFFTIHPVNVAAVTYIAGRANLLFSFFFLSSFLIFIKKATEHESPINPFLIIILFILSLLSKELAVVLPAIFIFYAYTFKDKTAAKNLGIIFTLVMIGFLYLILRATVLNFGVTKNYVFFYDFSDIFKRISDSIKISALYIWLLLIPIGLHMERTIQGYSIYFNAFLYLSFIIFCGLAVILLKRYKNLKFLRFSLGWFLIILLPVINLFIPLVSEMAEHWLYLPSIGYFAILSTTFINAFEKKNDALRKILFFILISMIGYYSITTHLQNRIWKDEFSLYWDILRYRPDDARVQLNLGSAYLERGDHDRAIQEYLKAIKLNPSYDEAHYDLADAYYKKGQTEQAMQQYLIAIKLNQNYIEAYNNLANIYDEMGRHDEAIELLKKSLKIKPNHIAYNNLGLAYYNKGSLDEAIEQYEKAVDLKPDYTKAYINLGNAYYKSGKTADAKRAWAKAVELDPALDYIKQNLKALER